jgi:hypothetical protein
LLKRGLQTPVTLTTEGAVGLTKAIDALWPKSLRIRGWFHKMQNLQQKVPPQAWPEFKALVADMRDAPSVVEAERRRTKVIPQLWTEGGLVKLVFAVLLRVSERWGKKGFSEVEQPQIRGLRRQLQLDLPDVQRPEPAAAPARRSAASAA